MISSVAIGDLVIRVEWKEDSKLTADAQVEILHDLAFNFGGGGAEIDTN